MEKLGSGAYSTVIACDNVAIKTLIYKDLASYIREIALIVACDHNYIIKITHIDFFSDKLQLIMPQYQMNLRECLYKYGRFEPALANKLVFELSSALVYLHDRGIIHCDIKPDNILCDMNIDNSIDGRLTRIFPAISKFIVCDFGISVLNCDNKHLSCVQTVSYRAPEISYTGRSRQITFGPTIDVWSFGCTLYEIICGSRLLSLHEDSSISACELFKVIGKNKRKSRISFLNNLKPQYVFKCIDELMRAKLLDNAVKFKDLIDIIAICMIPSVQYRAAARDIYNRIVLLQNTHNKLLTREVSDDSPRIKSLQDIIPRYDIDDMHCAINIPQYILIENSECLCLAELIYRRASVNGLMYKIACIYIAACIYSGTCNHHNILNKHPDVVSSVGDIFVALGGRIIV